MDISRVFPEYILKELPETASTNLLMEELLNTSMLPEGSVIFTEVQSAGIGQSGNVWESEPHKNLTATILLNPDFLGAENQFFITVVVSLAVSDTLEYFVPQAKAYIKWPNDIYCNHHKAAGILIKNHIIGSKISASIIGVGLNVNQTEFYSAPFATSLKKISGKDFSVNNVMTKWHECIAHYYLLLKNGERQILMDQYLSKLYLKGQAADFVINEAIVRATIKGVDRYGLLVLCDDNNKKYTCGLKEIVFPVFG